MKKFLILTILIGIHSLLYSQASLKNTPEQDSVKIHFKQLVSATQALIELKNLKKIQGLTQQQIHEKNAALQFYERGYKKYVKSDSVYTVLLRNKDTEIFEQGNQIADLRANLRINKAKKIGLSIALPVGIGLSFTAGFYLAKELLK